MNAVLPAAISLVKPRQPALIGVATAAIFAGVLISEVLRVEHAAFSIFE